MICYSTVGGGSCRKYDVGAFGYPRPKSGKCNDVAGRKSILDKAGCEAAATSLGLSDVEDKPHSLFPPGYFLYSNSWGRFVRYNTVITSTSSCSPYSDSCLCLSAPTCLETDGITSNAAPCLCGNTGCTIASGLHCYASENFCAVGPPCAVTDGSIANTEPCRCGNEGCTAVSGLHCYASENYCYTLPPLIKSTKGLTILEECLDSI